MFRANGRGLPAHLSVRLCVPGALRGRTLGSRVHHCLFSKGEPGMASVISIG